MALIPKFYMDAVVSIGIKKGISINWIGTGFFAVKRIDKDKFQPFLITNRHVLADYPSVVIRMIENSTGNLRVLDVPLIQDGKKLYSAHCDKNVDIAVVLLNGGFITDNNLQFSAFDIDEHALISSEFLKQGGDEGTYVYMLGFPLKLVNVDSNTPICRGGCIARIDAKEISNTKKYLLDIQNFPGNSGSPIISKPEVVSIDGGPALGRSVLIGIVHGYLPYEEELINSQTQKVVEIRSENSGIAVVNPVEFIHEVIDMEMKRNFGSNN